MSLSVAVAQSAYRLSARTIETDRATVRLTIAVN
jgi:hypothetical protein